MPHETHSWADGSIPTIRAHSVAKHRVLAEYLKLYVATLTSNIRRDKLKITIVDGFAGGNIYFDEISGRPREGSPSIILESMKEAADAATVRRTKPFCFVDDYFFIEKNRCAYESLNRTLGTAGYGARIDKNIFLMRGNFADFHESILEFINRKRGGGRALFVLDQCGYGEVPFEYIRQILSTVENAEIILTFAAEQLVDYLSDKRPNRPLRKNPELDLQELASGLDKSDPFWKRIILHKLLGEIRRLSQAKYFTPFFIRSNDSNRDIWLIHLSQHPTARDVMMGVHWNQQNTFSHYGGDGLDMLGFDIKTESPQRSQAGFYFDERARDRTILAVTNQLPVHLAGLAGPITFASLLSSVANNTPATAEMLKEVLGSLAKDKQLVIRDTTALTTRRNGVQDSKDIIILPERKPLFFRFEDYK